MAEHMKLIDHCSNDGLTNEERSLFLIAFNNVVGSRRASWRVIKQPTSADSACVETYRLKIEHKLDKLCRDVLALLDTHVLPTSVSAEDSVFCYKMKGDYLRASAEIQQSWHPMRTRQRTRPRLGLVLNFSVFRFDILGSLDHACTMAKQAFDDTIAELDTLSETSYRDSVLVMQLLRDNFTNKK